MSAVDKLSGDSLIARSVDWSKIEETVDFAVARVRAAARELGNAFPTAQGIDPQTGKWRAKTSTDWVSGYWPGLLWLAYRHTGDQQYKEWAYKWCALMEPCKYHTHYHDIGVMFYDAFVTGYKLVRDPALREAALTAADSLIRRFNPKGGYLQAWGKIGDPESGGRTIVDTMIVLPLLWWAYRETGNRNYFDVAFAHSKKSARYHIRPDGSTYHIIDFDPENGELVRCVGGQGYSERSAWARGVAWAITGFAIAYRESGYEPFRLASERTADFFVSNLPEDSVPFWDFRAPNIPDEPRDTSAAALAASGLLQLAECVPVEDAAKRRADAWRILTGLIDNYLTRGQEYSAALRAGTVHAPKNLGVDVGIVYGDFYLLEALTKLLWTR